MTTTSTYVTPATAIGLRKIAVRYGLALDTVKKYRSWGYLPDPVFVVSGTPVWDTRDLDVWATGRDYDINQDAIG